MSAKDWLEGLFWGFSITAVVTLIVVLIFPTDKTYLVSSDGVRVESVVEFSTRGNCLERMEKHMKDGPKQLVWQCVDKYSNL